MVVKMKANRSGWFGRVEKRNNDENISEIRAKGIGEKR